MISSSLVDHNPQVRVFPIVGVELTATDHSDQSVPSELLSSLDAHGLWLRNDGPATVSTKDRSINQKRPSDSSQVRLYLSQHPLTHNRPILHVGVKPYGKSYDEHFIPFTQSEVHIVQPRAKAPRGMAMGATWNLPLGRQRAVAIAISRRITLRWPVIRELKHAIARSETT